MHSKKHFPILDGLRGIAALIVVIFHIYEFNATSIYDQIINHGYLAVDFFFALSGFVIGYAYDDRWSSMSLKTFFKRRIIRLQPLVILGSVLGAIGFYATESTAYPALQDVSVWKLLGVMLLGCIMVPVTKPLNIRGWDETFPLNGPAWSLFYEYVANVLYACGLRKVSTKVLVLLMTISGLFLIHHTVYGERGDVVGGWDLSLEQIKLAFIRLMYPFLSGLLLSRIIGKVTVKNGFLVCSLILTVLLVFPRVGDSSTNYLNGLYDAFSIIIVFPFIIFLGANAEVSSSSQEKWCRFLGDISYPLYITHFVFIYFYIGWLSDNPNASVLLKSAYGSLTFVLSILLAYVALKWFDEPVRKWLQLKWK